MLSSEPEDLGIKCVRYLIGSVSDKFGIQWGLVSDVFCIGWVQYQMTYVSDRFSNINFRSREAVALTVIRIQIQISTAVKGFALVCLCR
jgi:hypothetical protein